MLRQNTRAVEALVDVRRQPANLDHWLTLGDFSPELLTCLIPALLLDQPAWLTSFASLRAVDWTIFRQHLLTQPTLPDADRRVKHADLLVRLNLRFGQLVESRSLRALVYLAVDPRQFPPAVRELNLLARALTTLCSHLRSTITFDTTADNTMSPVEAERILFEHARLSPELPWDEMLAEARQILGDPGNVEPDTPTKPDVGHDVTPSRTHERSSSLPWTESIRAELISLVDQQILTQDRDIALALLDVKEAIAPQAFAYSWRRLLAALAIDQVICWVHRTPVTERAMPAGNNLEPAGYMIDGSGSIKPAEYDSARELAYRQAGLYHQAALVDKSKSPIPSRETNQFGFLWSDQPLVRRVGSLGTVSDVIARAVSSALISLEEPMVMQPAAIEAIVEQRLRVAIGEMSAGAGHEINNPLGAIAGQARLIESRASDPEIRHSVTRIVDQVERIHRMIKDLQLIGRRTCPKSVEVNLVQILAEATKQSARFADQCELLIEQPSERIVVLADAADLTRVIVEILKNAISAAGRQGWVNVRVLSSATSAGARHG